MVSGCVWCVWQAAFITNLRKNKWAIAEEVSRRQEMASVTH